MTNSNRILQKNSTHKAVENKTNKTIDIYLNHIPKDAIAPDGSRLFSNEDIKKYPHWFKDELLWSIPLEDKEDLFAIFETLDENNRINVAEANAAMNC